MPLTAVILHSEQKGGRLPGNFEVELEDRLLAAHNYGTGLLQGGVPEHLRFQWAAADKLMKCRTPTELAHAIAARFPHSTYAVSRSHPPLHCICMVTCMTRKTKSSQWSWRRLGLGQPVN